MRRLLRNMLGAPEARDDAYVDLDHEGGHGWDDNDQWDGGDWGNTDEWNDGGDWDGVEGGRRAEDWGSPGRSAFDSALSRELIDPTVIELDGQTGGSTGAGQSDIEPSPNFAGRRRQPDVTTGRPRHPDAIAQAVDSTLEENDRLRAEMLPGPSVATPTTGWVEHRPAPAVLAPGPLPATTTPASAPGTVPQGLVAPSPNPIAADLEPTPVEAPAPPATSAVSVPAAPGPGPDFWDCYDEAAASAELCGPPPAAVAVIIGPLTAAVEVARRCQDDHWVGSCDVFVLTDRPDLVDDSSWTVLSRPSDVVAVLEGGDSDFPLIVIDVPEDLPAWIRPLMIRLRNNGVGLVRYVLDGSPTDEDLATWHGELGRPSVLDLTDHVEPDRVVELLDRGEPVVSVAGTPISTELLLALRLATSTG